MVLPLLCSKPSSSHRMKARGPCSNLHTSSPPPRLPRLLLGLDLARQARHIPTLGPCLGFPLSRNALPPQSCTAPLSPPSKFLRKCHLLSEAHPDHHVYTVICNSLPTPPPMLLTGPILSLLYYSCPYRTCHPPIAAALVIGAVTTQICAINTCKRFYPKCII